MIYWQYSFIYTEKELLDPSFLFIFLSRWLNSMNSNKFELIQLHKNMKKPSL